MNRPTTLFAIIVGVALLTTVVAVALIGVSGSGHPAAASNGDAPSTASASAEESGTGALRIEVRGLKPDGSYLRLEVLDGPEAWKTPTRPVAALRARVFRDAMQFVLHGLKPERLGVRLYQDLNDNGRLDKNMLGIPTEGWGYSGDRELMGPPSFDDAAFDLVESGTTIRIVIR